MQVANSYDESSLPDDETFDWNKYKWRSHADYAVILNFNGVLLASRKTDRAAWMWLFDQLEYKLDDDGLAALIDCGVPTRFSLLTLVDRLGIERSNVEQFAIAMALRKEQYEVAGFIAEGEEMPGAQALLDALGKQRIPLGLYSMFSQRSVLEILRAIKLKQFFTAVVTPDIAVGRGGGIALEHCLSELVERLGVKRDNCFLVEDSAPRVRTATQFGIACIGVGLSNEQKLRDEGAIEVVDDLRPLVPIFRGRNRKKAVLAALKQGRGR